LNKWGAFFEIQDCTHAQQKEVFMNRSVFSYSIFGLMLFICIPSRGAGAGNPKTTQGTEHPSFVVPPGTAARPTDNSDAALQPPIQQDESVTPSSALNFDAESAEHPLGRGTPGFALLLGGALQHTGSRWDSAPTVAARYYFPR